MRQLFFLVLSIISLTSCAQIPDVPAAFNAIKATPEVLHLKRNHIKVPSGGHLQGIQCLSDSELIITASSSSYAYYLTTNRTELKSIVKLGDSPFRHAGGCQVFDHTLVVGVEDNMAKDRSNIIMLLFHDLEYQGVGGQILQRSGTFKRSTAGAVGYTKTANGDWLIAVADWDSRNIDFYHFSGGATALLGSAVIPSDEKWPSYQSINLLTDTAGKIYLIGFALDGTKNRADLFEVILHEDKAELKLISTRNFKCKGTSFRYGSGIYINAAHQLHIYSCARNVTSHTAINIFK